MRTWTSNAEMSTSVERAVVPDEQSGPVPLISVVIPCLNEAENIEQCITTARQAMERAGISGEVLVADNGSEDGSAELAELAGARVVHEPVRGYGSAYLAGFAAARGKYIVMADADLSYDFNEIPRFLAELEAGADMIIGDRMQNIHPGAMPWHHRYIGNPLLSRFLNLLFHTGVSDAHCGMRVPQRPLERLTRAPRGWSSPEMVSSEGLLEISPARDRPSPRGGSRRSSSATADTCATWSCTPQVHHAGRGDGTPAA
jgi:glycosyltransferase involved in cell wall biosynthesis